MATLQKIRDKSWLLVTVIGVALLAFVFMDGASSLSGGGCNSTPVENVGVVSGVDISLEDFENKIQQQEGIINFVYRQNIVDDAMLRDQVWDYYVKKIITEKEFEKIGLDISDEEWVLKIKDQNNTHEILKKLFTDSSGIYNGELAWNQIQQISQLPDGDPNKKLWKDCEESILFDYKFQKYQTLIGQSMYATSHEAKDNILFDKQNARFDYVAIPYTNINNEDVVITENDIESYYSKNKMNYKRQASNDVELIFFTPEPSVKDENDAKSFISSAITNLEGAQEYNSFRSSPYDNFYNYVYNNANISSVNWENIIQKEASRQLQMLIDAYGSQQDLEKAAGSKIFEIRSQLITDYKLTFENIKSQKNEARNGLTQEQWLELFNSEQGKVIGPYLVSEGVYRIAKNSSVELRPDSVEVRHIMISIPPVQQAGDQYAVLVEEAKKDVDSIKLLIESGANFDNFVSLSDDIMTKNRGGNLGWIVENTTMLTGFGEKSQLFNDLCFEKEVGSLSVVRSDYGYHLVQVTKRGPLVRKVKIVYADKEVVISDQTKDNYLLQAAKFKQEFSKNKADLDKLVTKYNGLLRSAKEVKYTDQSILNIDKSREIIKWLYKNDEGSISDVKELFNSKSDIVVAYALKKYEEGVIPLNDVKEQIKSIVINEKKATKIKEDISNLSDLNDIANMYSTNVVLDKSIKFFDTLTNLGFGRELSLLGHIFGSKPNIMSKPIVGNNAIYIVNVKSFDDITIDDEEILIRKASIRKRSSFSADFSYKALKDASETSDQRILFY
tara:strand:- start:6357 stop:8708 length:2352 start_codon:yes stop_codon:yes gene_type:complete